MLDPLERNGQVITSHNISKKEAQLWHRPIWVQKTALSTHLLHDRRLPALRGAQSRERLCSRLRLPCLQPLLLGLYDPKEARPMGARTTKVLKKHFPEWANLPWEASESERCKRWTLAGTAVPVPPASFSGQGSYLPAVRYISCWALTAASIPRNRLQP